MTRTWRRGVGLRARARHRLRYGCRCRPIVCFAPSFGLLSSCSVFFLVMSSAKNVPTLMGQVHTPQSPLDHLLTTPRAPLDHPTTTSRPPVPTKPAHHNTATPGRSQVPRSSVAMLTRAATSLISCGGVARSQAMPMMAPACS